MTPQRPGLYIVERGSGTIEIFPDHKAAVQADMQPTLDAMRREIVDLRKMVEELTKRIGRLEGIGVGRKAGMS
jgi:hypothetical protein